ncbi:MAG: hypothetical protein GY857_09160, partial [Desulfobacula sp.]|nr:hypothetical protein [Desulfobacula sp.]
MGEIYTPFEIKNLFDQQFFSSLDYFFARSMEKAFDEKNAVVLVSCALVSKVLSKGHICFDIKETSNTIVSVSRNSDVKIKFPEFDTWLSALQNSAMVSDTIDTPLVLDSNHRLYFAKYFDFQNRLISSIVR